MDNLIICRHRRLSASVELGETRRRDDPNEVSVQNSRKDSFSWRKKFNYKATTKLYSAEAYSENQNWPRLMKFPGNKMLQEKPKRYTRLTSLRLTGLRSNTSHESSSESKSEEVFNPFCIKNDLQNMLKTIPGANVTTEVIARTAEYNDIVLCKITQTKSRKSKHFRAEEDKYMEEEAEKKIILIVHGLSAMGFTKVPCLYNQKDFLKLVQMYSAHLDKFDIFLVPMANPDGIGDHTLALWNKNKSVQKACSGVALDRNFDVAWNGSRTSSCNQQYPGPEAFSEPESRAIGDLIHLFSHKIVAYIHVHAGTYTSDVFKGDAVLYPKGFAEVNTDDDKYIDMKGEIEEAMSTAGFRVMSVTVDSLYNWYGYVAGTSVDYAASIYGVPYALEFVMQLYDDDPNAKSSSEYVTDNILTEIWKKIIDVVFTNVHKNTLTNEV